MKKKKKDWEAYVRGFKAQIESERPAKQRGIRAKVNVCAGPERPDPPVGTPFTKGGKTYKNVTQYRNSIGVPAKVDAFYKRMVRPATTAQECEEVDCLNDCYGPNY